MTTTFETAQVGDKVWCIYNGWQTIESIDFNNIYPIETNITLYTYEGEMAQNKGRTLFWDEVIITPPPKPAPKLEVDTKVLVWDSDETMKFKRHFSHFDKFGNIYVFVNGLSSWHEGIAVRHTHWELANE